MSFARLKPRVSLGEIAVAGLGFGLAGLTAGFAGYMVAVNDHQPRIGGLQYLAIFAQPRGGRAAATPAQKAPPPVAAIDPTPTGSIALPRLDSEPVAIVAAERGAVWIKIGGTIRAAQPGDNLPGLGRVGAIAERGGRWVLLDESGAELAPRGGASAGPGGAPARAKPLVLNPSAR